MNRSDVIVIGGGLAGISAAARLAADASVVVLEREKQLGYHSTGRSAAIFIQNYGNPTLRALNARSARFFAQPDDIFDGRLLKPRGELLLAGETELDALEDYARGAEGLERLIPSEAVELVPILRPDPIAAAVYEPQAQDIDVDRLLQGFARLLTSRRGKIVTNAEVREIARSDGIWAVRSGADSYTAPVVVNAAGAWAADIARLAGALPIELGAYRRSMALLPAPDGGDVDQWPLFGSVTETWYAKPDAGRLLVSPADEDRVEPHDAWADDTVLAEGLFRYESAVTEPVTRVLANWAGLRTFAPDRTPVVGPDPQAEGFYWLAGQGGYGIQTAPALSQYVAEALTGANANEDSALHNALRPERFFQS